MLIVAMGLVFAFTICVNVSCHGELLQTSACSVVDGLEVRQEHLAQQVRVVHGTLDPRLEEIEGYHGRNCDEQAHGRSNESLGDTSHDCARGFIDVAGQVLE